jgi:hypothetical protein
MTQSADKTQLSADFLSREPARVHRATWTVINTRDPAVLGPPAADLVAIERATRNLDLGGELHANARALAHALDRLRHYRDGSCLCADYTTLEFYDPAEEQARAHVLILDTVPNDHQWEPDRICQCTGCGKRFQVEQGESHYSWWRWQELPA